MHQIQEDGSDVLCEEVLNIDCLVKKGFLLCKLGFRLDKGAVRNELN